MNTPLVLSGKTGRPKIGFPVAATAVIVWLIAGCMPGSYTMKPLDYDEIVLDYV
jgi:hypothetical protein